MKRVYWSIDIDWWINSTDDELKIVLDDLLTFGVPIYVVVDHHYLVRYIHKIKFDTLINSDFHSDIVDDRTLRWNRKLAFNCGTWANYIKERNQKTFIWHRPKYTEDEILLCNTGYCHWSGRSPFSRIYKPSGYKRVMKRSKLYPLSKDGKVVAIGIALSPGYSINKHIAIVKNWINKNRKFIKITKDARSFLKKFSVTRYYNPS